MDRVTASNSHFAPLGSLPHALTNGMGLAERLRGRTPAVFLDYDGTLTPIVDDPAAATLPTSARKAVERLARLCPVAVVSGRDRADVQALVGIDGLVYAGSHGFDIAGPGWEHQHPDGAAAQPALAAAADQMERALGNVPGLKVERKRYAVAVHVRQVDPAAVPSVDETVERAVNSVKGLRRTAGKMVFELRPALDWDKGRALQFLLDELGLRSAEMLPMYIGDDDTDEDALVTIRDSGLGVIVGTEDRATAAHLRLDDPGETVVFLGLLADLLEGVG